MTINPRERIFPWKIIVSSVMSYLYITDEKGERFCLVAGVIQYLMEAFTKRKLLLAKMKSFICDVIPHYHLIEELLNNIQDYQLTGTDISIQMK